MDDKFAKQLRTIVGDVVEEKLDQKVGIIIVDQKLDEKLQPIREQIAHIPNDMINVFNDGFDALVSKRLYDVEETTEDHKKRIKKLEKNIFAAS